ncbi:hypothetical protein EV424DRAFT_671476 [Suillus variegatus]|nr:hypothetical protein EV424DRAFT_671476 [Suillus variegatus]
MRTRLDGAASFCRIVQFSGNVPTFNGNIKEHALMLWSMKIPFDGDSPISSQSPDDLDLDDGPYIELDLVPKSMSPMSAPSTRVIAFDLFGTILDCDGAINDAMRLLLPTHPDRHRLSEMYLECELMRHRDNSDAPYTSIMQQALEDVCVFLEVLLSEVVLYKAVQAVLQPSLYANAEAAVGTLLDQGYALLSLPIPDCKVFFTSTTSIWPQCR